MPPRPSPQSREALVFATEATCSSHAYQRALARRGFATLEKACPLLVPLVEEGWIETPGNRAGGAHLHHRSPAHCIGKCRCTGARLYPLSSAASSAAARGSAAHRDRRFRRGYRARAPAPSRTATTLQPASRATGSSSPTRWKNFASRLRSFSASRSKMWSAPIWTPGIRTGERLSFHSTFGMQKCIVGQSSSKALPLVP